MLTCSQSILSHVHYTTATRDSLTALRRLSSPVSYMRLQRTLCGVCTPLHQRGRDVRLDRPVRGDWRSTRCAGRATISVHSCTGRAAAARWLCAKTWGKARPSLRTVKSCATELKLASRRLHRLRRRRHHAIATRRGPRQCAAANLVQHCVGLVGGADTRLAALRRVGPAAVAD